MSWPKRHLVLWHVALSWLPALSLAPTVLTGARIDAGLAAHVSSGLPRSCSCHYSCKMMNCTTYSVTRQSGGVFQCRLSSSPVPRYAWPDHDDSYVVHKTDYEISERHFFKFVTTGEYSTGRTTCRMDQSQLPVLLDEAAKAEFFSVMQYHGAEAAWVGAHRPPNQNTNENELPRWTFFNGTSVIDQTLPTYYNFRCYAMNTSLPELIVNFVPCGTALAIICQRDY